MNGQKVPPVVRSVGKALSFDHSPACAINACNYSSDTVGVFCGVREDKVTSQLGGGYHGHVPVAWWSVYSLRVKAN